MLLKDKTPGTLATWETMILMHTSGSLIYTPILDEKGHPQSNALGCMIHYSYAMLSLVMKNMICK
jgi:hypothetical protein